MDMLDRMIKDQQKADAAAPPPKKTEVVSNYVWLAGYAKKKPVKNFGGNFWGINRNRCSIIKPNMIKALISGGHIVMNGVSEFTVVPTTK